MNSLILIVTIALAVTSSQARTARNEQISSSTSTSLPKATTETVTKSTTRPTPTTVASSTTPSPPTPTQTTTTATTALAQQSSNTNNNTITNRIQLLSNSGSTLASNLINSLSNNLSQLFNQLTNRIKLPIKSTQTVNNLWSSIRRSDLVRSPLTLSVAGVTFAGFISLIALYTFPSLREASIPIFSDRNQIKLIGEIGRSIDQIAETVDAAIDSYSRSESDTCIKIALCTLGKAKEVSRRSRAIDAVNTVLT